MLFRKIMRVLLPFALAAAVIGTTATAADAANVPPTPPSWAEIFLPYFNAGQFKCLDDTNGSTSEGNPQQVYHCHGYASNGAPQRWEFFNQGDSTNPYYEIQNVASQKCLTADGYSIVQKTCNAQYPQLWFVQPTANVGAYFALQSLYYLGYCLATRDSSGKDNTGVTIATCNYDNQNDPTWIRQVWSIG